MRRAHDRAAECFYGLVGIRDFYTNDVGNSPAWRRKMLGEALVEKLERAIEDIQLASLADAFECANTLAAERAATGFERFARAGADEAARIAARGAR